MKAGSQTLRTATGIQINDNGASVLNGFSMGWFFVRLLTTITVSQINDLKTNHGIEFKTNEMIQFGWYKKFLSEEQVSYMNSMGIFSSFYVKEYKKCNFDELKDEKELLVYAVEGWKPKKGSFRNYFSPNMFIVEGASAEEIYEDPLVEEISKVPKVSLDL